VPFRNYDDLTSWVMSTDYPRYYQLEWVAGVSRWWPYSYYNEEASLTVCNNKRLLLRLAQENLAKTTWFGITERFNASICLFFYTHRIMPVSEGKDYRSIHRYVTVGGASAAVATAEDLQRSLLSYDFPFCCPALLRHQVLILVLRSRLEYEFFHWAEKLFELRLEHMRKDFRRNKAQMLEYVAPECVGVL
jgi:hypothetical protein